VVNHPILEAFLGYDNIYCKEPTLINLEAIVEELAQHPIVPTPEES